MLPSSSSPRRSGWRQGRIRKPGGGRKRTVDLDPTLRSDLEEAARAGDPWGSGDATALDLQELATAGGRAEPPGSPHESPDGGRVAPRAGLQPAGNRKTIEGTSHPDRNAQFEHINRKVNEHLRTKDPVISVDTKKKELVGNFKNGGREWRPQGDPEQVQVHDFVVPELGRAIPYGVYDLGQNTGWVSVGVDHDTVGVRGGDHPALVVRDGTARLPSGQEAARSPPTPAAATVPVSHLWKLELQKLADEIGLPISVCHFPPGTSKWNKIEHRLFSFISQNWRGRPLISHQVIVNLIAGTRTATGLKVRAVLDRNTYRRVIKVDKKAVADIQLRPARFHGDWNYTILPNQSRD